MQNLVKICSQGLVYKYTKYNDFVTFCTFPSLPFCLVAFSKNDWTFLLCSSSYDTVLCKEVSFGF